MIRTRGNDRINLIITSTLFWLTAFFCLLPFFTLSFFNDPSSDDYLYSTLYRDLGFAGAQKKLYLEWIGRFTVTFLHISFVKFAVIQQHYYLHTLLLFVFSFCSAFFAFSKFNRYIFDHRYKSHHLAKASVIFLILNLYCYDDVASSFYWFSGAITYQTPVILLFLLTGFVIERIYRVHQKSFLWIDLLNACLIILIAGCNETFAISIIVLLVFAAVVARYYKSPLQKLFICYAVISLFAGLLIVLTSGILQRLEFMPQSRGNFTLVVIVLFRFLFILWNIFKEPLFWASAIFIFFIGRGINEKYFLSLRVTLVRGLIIIFLLLMSILIPLIILTKGTFPPRALNDVILIAMIAFFILAFLAGINSNAVGVEMAKNRFSMLAYTLLFCIIMLSSTNYVNAWKSLLPAYFYHQVLSSRQKQLSEAVMRKERIISIPPFDVELKKSISKLFPDGSFVTLNQLLLQKPSVIITDQQVEDEFSPALLDYYQVDSIRMLK
jgi:hypothetical protein